MAVRPLAALGVALAFGLATRRSSATEPHAVAELAGSGAVQGPTSGLEAPGGVYINKGTALEEAVAFGLGFDPTIMTRVRYGRGGVTFPGAFPRVFQLDGPGEVVMEDFRLETAWRPGKGFWRPYFGVGAGYRRIETVSGSVFMGGAPSDPFRLTPQGGVAGVSVGVSLSGPPTGRLHAYALLLVALDVSALHAQDAHPFPPPPPYPLPASLGRVLESNYSVTPSLQTWLALRLELGLDLDL